MPTILAYFCGTKVLAATLSLKFLVCIEGVAALVEVYAVVAHAALAEQGFEFGEEIGMMSLVLFLAAWFQVHFECFSFHS